MLHASHGSFEHDRPDSSVEQGHAVEASSALRLADQLAGVTPLLLARERMLPVAEALQPIVGGGGLQRGSTVAVGGPAGALSLTFSLVAEAARQGSWVAIVGGPWLVLAAVAEYGIPLERVVLVDHVELAAWSTVVSSLLDGFDIVIVAHPQKVGARDSRRLVARTRERGALLVRVGGPSWSDAADLRFDVVASQWFGAGEGHGHLRSRRVQLLAGGRRGASLERRYALWLPDATGTCRLDTPSRQAQTHTRQVPGLANFAGSDVEDLLSAELESAELESAELQSAELESAEFESAEFESAELQSAEPEPVRAATCTQGETQTHTQDGEGERDPDQMAPAAKRHLRQVG